jgi:hypothetical protein
VEPEALAEWVVPEALAVQEVLAAPVVLAVLAASAVLVEPVEWAVSVELGGVVVPAHRNYRPVAAATPGSITHNIAAVHRIGIELQQTGLAVRLAATHSQTARLERDSR